MAILLRYVFAARAATSTVEGFLVERMAHMALRHPTAEAIVAHREYMTGEDGARWAAWVDAGRRIRIDRKFGFLADCLTTHHRTGCALCGRNGEMVGHLCPMCGVDMCVVCLRWDNEPERWCGAWDAGVASPMCLCMWNRHGDVRQLPRGALCMIEDTPGILVPVPHVWQR